MMLDGWGALSRQRCFCRKQSGLDFAGTDSEYLDIFAGGRMGLLVGSDCCTE